MEELEILSIKNIDELIDLLKKSSITYDFELINKAYEFAKKAHSEQTRSSGELYISHVLNVAALVAKLRLDTVSIVASLLHDCADKAGISIDEIDKEFGTEVAFIVNGLTQIRDFSKKVSDEKQDIENFKNLIFNAAEDIRIVIIRLCEKLNNLQTIEIIDYEMQKKAAIKGLNIYGPLAEYLGLGLIQRSIEDISFKIVFPDEYKIITESLDAIYKDSQNALNDLEKYIPELLVKYNFKPETINSRRKGNYSIYKKLKKKSEIGVKFVTFENILKLHDIFAVRIIVNTIEECYMVLGLIHSKWEYIQEEYNDYIAKPKDNGYRSLQTNIVFENKIIEIQIRTMEMHEYNEFGPASHIAYKIQGSKNASNSLTWTKELIKWKTNDQLSKDDFKVKAFSQSIFVFTPKGLVVSLPKDASPIDFAFRIHTSIGYHYAGALVNGKMVSMDHKLQTGDVVEIHTNKNVNANQGWMKFARANSTKARIRRIMKHDKESVYGID
jgi:guanosine-3',5'-bis(diphosphate) 3'-pyrophosphohydrolase